MSTKFDSTISLGNIITALSMLLTLGVGYGVHVTTVSIFKEKLDNHQVRIEADEKAINAIELSQSQTFVKLQYISDNISEIKSSIAKLRP